MVELRFVWLGVSPRRASSCSARKAAVARDTQGLPTHVRELLTHRQGLPIHRLIAGDQATASSFGRGTVSPASAAAVAARR
jgi:hypothetical protein